VSAAAVFALGGAVAGAIQVRALARTARGEATGLLFLARLLLVGAVLLLAALAGHLAVGGGGWTAGFILAGVVTYRGIR
jgi:hypothetical protein